MRLRLTGIVVVFPLFLSAQQYNCVEKEINDTNGSLINFGYNQRTEKFCSPLNYAANYFPELKGCKIEVRRKKITTMMAARPKRDFIFRSKANRKYILLITDKYDMNADSIYNDMSSCAIVGVLGHELSHIVSYSEKSGTELIFFGIKYVLNRKKIESETDMTAIEHGFGPGLVEYTHYIHQSPLVNKRYLLRKKKYYLSANELESRLHEKL